MNSSTSPAELHRRRFSVGPRGNLDILESRINGWLLSRSRWLRIERIEATMTAEAVSVVVFYDEPPQEIRGNTIPQTRCCIVVKDSEEELQAVVDRVTRNGVFHLYEHLGKRSENEPAVGIFLYHTRIELVCMGATVRAIRSSFTAWLNANATRSLPEGISAAVKGPRVYLAVPLSPYEQSDSRLRGDSGRRLTGKPIFGPARLVKAALIDPLHADPKVHVVKSEIVTLPTLKVGPSAGDSVAFVLQSTESSLGDLEFDY
jgi:hypothetical protein